MSPLDLQRIVDGELDHSARAEILRSLGDDARQWRCLALALIEEQQWSRELRSAPCPADAARISGSEPHPNNPPQSPHRPTEAVAAGSPASVSLASSGPSFASTPWFQALAASVVLGIGMAGGMLVRGLPRGEVVGRMAEQPARLGGSTNQVAQADQHPGPPTRPPMRMVLSGRGDASNPAVEIPIVDGAGIDPKTVLARDARELAQWQDSLKRQGYSLEWKPKLYSGRLNDGSQVVVPVHNVLLKPSGL